MISNITSPSSFLQISQRSNTNNQYFKQTSDTGSVKYEGDLLFVHNGVDYVPIFEYTDIDLSPQWKFVLEWAQQKMYEEMENNRILEKYPEAKQSRELYQQVLQTLKAMEALVGKNNLD